MGSLTGPEADVVRLYHLEGKSYREISSAIGIPENSIGPTLSRLARRCVERWRIRPREGFRPTTQGGTASEPIFQR